MMYIYSISQPLFNGSPVKEANPLLTGGSFAVAAVGVHAVAGTPALPAAAAAGTRFRCAGRTAAAGGTRAPVAAGAGNRAPAAAEAGNHRLPSCTAAVTGRGSGLDCVLFE